MTATASVIPDLSVVDAASVDAGVGSGIDDIELNVEEAPIVAAEAAAAARVVPGELAQRAAALAEAAAGGVVTGELVETLEYVATTSLTGGRARRLYRAEGEKLLNRVLLRTPAGQTSHQSVEDLNRALSALADRQIGSVRVATRIPGSHTVRIEADGLVFTLGFSAAGATIESVAT